MPKKHEIVVPAAEDEWGDPVRDDAHRAPSLLPWDTYDRFIKGVSIAELAIADISSDALILADIEQMRDYMRQMHPGLTDGEADIVRFEDILIRESMSIGDSTALKVAAEAHVRRRRIIEAALQRFMTRGY